MNTATWNGKNIRVFNQAMSKSQTAGFGGLQTVVFNTVQASDGNGTIYNSNAWDFTPTITAQSINTPYALAQVNVGRSVDASGNWLIGGSITTSVAASAGITLSAYVLMLMTMTPRGIGQKVPELFGRSSSWIHLNDHIAF
jgi:hypothetical protein